MEPMQGGIPPIVLNASQMSMQIVTTPAGPVLVLSLLAAGGLAAAQLTVPPEGVDQLIQNLEQVRADLPGRLAPATAADLARLSNGRH